MDLLWAGGRSRVGSEAKPAAGPTPILYSRISVGFAAVLCCRNRRGARHSYCAAGKYSYWDRPARLWHFYLLLVFQGFSGSPEEIRHMLAVRRLAAHERRYSISPLELRETIVGAKPWAGRPSCGESIESCGPDQQSPFRLRWRRGHRKIALCEAKLCERVIRRETLPAQFRTQP